MNKDSRLHNWVALGLRITVGISVVLLILGSILCGISGVEPTSFAISLHGASLGTSGPLTITTIGVFLLLFTPLLGIILSAIAFSLGREKLYLAISIVILCLLIGLVLATM